MPPPLTPPVDVTPPALLPPEPDGELLELQASSENAAREKAPRKSRVRPGFPHDETPVQCDITPAKVEGGDILPRNSLLNDPFWWGISPLTNYPRAVLWQKPYGSEN